MSLISLDDIQSKIIEIRGQKVILDSEIAKLYSVETKHVNQAVKNNPQKFPEGYLIVLDEEEWMEVKSKFLTSPLPLGGGKVKIPNAFTEKGLYMLATILKSEQATLTTIAIIDTFAKLRELSSNIKQLSHIEDQNTKQSVLEKSGKMITQLLYDDTSSNESETTIELNFAVLKLKHSIKKSKKKPKSRET